MQPPNLPKPQVIRNQQELLEILPQLNSGDSLAVDTESNSLHAYQEQVCLIQFSTRHRDLLVDPLAIDDLSPLAPLLADPGLEKIYHAAEYDIMTLKRDFGFEQENLFDTYIAVRTLGWENSGLASILETAFDIKLKKRFQRANWARRPLPDEMLDYARFDTHFLIPLRDQLTDKLKETGRWQEAKELFELQALAPPHSNGFDPDGYWEVGDTRRLSGRQAAILRELYLFREKEAKRRDVPPFIVLGNRSMLSLAKNPPATREELQQIRGMSGKRLERYGDDALNAIRRGQQAPTPERPKTRRTPDEVRDRFERLRNWRKHTGRQRNIDSDLVLPRDYLWDIAHRNPQTADELRSVLQPLEWRFQHYGDDILKILKE
ncbi:MAG: ribonuclease D [Anaerolineales bacterium]